jgi:hypothetical protein
MPYCQKCGKQHEEDAAFCSYCGTRIEALQPPSQEPQIQEEKPRGAQHLRAIEVAGILFIVIVSAAIIIHQTMPYILSPQPTQTLTSTDWSGYSISTSLKNPQPTVTRFMDRTKRDPHPRILLLRSMDRSRRTI